MILVPSERNLADALTKVPKKWLLTRCAAFGVEVSATESGTAPVSVEHPQVRRIHHTGHFRVEWTLLLVG